MRIEKKDLQEKGYFDEKNKKKIPYLPLRIGVITSPTGSVIHDIINRISDRFKTPSGFMACCSSRSRCCQKILLKPLLVLIKFLDQHRPDVIIIARGGGSTEDLNGV